MEKPTPHIYLVGFMGSGKSTIARHLHQQYHIDMIDMDAYITNQENRSIPEIFAQNGEAYFRAAEYNALQAIHLRTEPTIISTGGGAACQEAFWDTVSASRVVYLRRSVDFLVEILKNDTQRPLLNNKDPKELALFIQNKLTERLPFYQRAAVHMPPGLGVDQSCALIAYYFHLQRRT